MKKLILLLLLFLLFPSILFASVYSASDYTQLYNYSQTVNYTDCGNNNASKQLTGYRYMYNLDDPIIGCGEECGTCTLSTQYTQFQQVSTYLRRFKVYVPIGATSILVKVFTENNARYVAIARAGQPPGGDYDSYTNGKTTDDYLLLNNLGFTDVQLKTGDCIATNQEGILSIATGVVFGGVETSGYWIYVIVLPVSGNFRLNSVNNVINSAPYMAWFRGMTESNWTSFGSAVVPTPTPTATPTATPTPTPTATPTPTVMPTPTPVGCGSGGACPSNYHCVSGACVPTTSPTPTPTSGSNCGQYGPCPANYKCISGACIPVWPTATPSPTPGANCGTYGPCPANYHCVSDVCAPLITPTPTPTISPAPTGCGAYGPCPANYHCVDGQCVKLQSSNNDYSQGLFCAIFGGKY